MLTVRGMDILHSPMFFPASSNMLNCSFSSSVGSPTGSFSFSSPPIAPPIAPPVAPPIAAAICSAMASTPPPPIIFAISSIPSNCSLGIFLSCSMVELNFSSVTSPVSAEAIMVPRAAASSSESGDSSSMARALIASRVAVAS